MINQNQQYSLDGQHSHSIFSGLAGLVNFEGDISPDANGFFTGIFADEEKYKVVGHIEHKKFSTRLAFLTLGNFSNHNITKAYSMINTTRSSFLYCNKTPETFDGCYVGMWFYMGLGLFDHEYLKPEFFKDRDKFMEFIGLMESKDGLGGYADVCLIKK